MITRLDTTTDLGAQLQCDLAQVDAVLVKQLQVGHGPVDELCGELSHYRGKMLRPSLVLLAASASASGASRMAPDSQSAMNPTMRECGKG